MHPLSMVVWQDRLLQEPERWRKVRLPRADGAGVRAIAVRVQASQRWLMEALALCTCPRCRTRFTRSDIILDTS